MQDFQEKIIEFILKEWRKLPEGERPLYLWIRHYDDFKAELDHLHFDTKQTPLIVWFAENDQVEQRSICQWSRFATVQFNDTWNRRQSEQNPILKRQVFEIGLTAFVPLGNHNKFYVECFWGGVNGWGVIVRVMSDNSIEVETKLWSS